MKLRILRFLVVLIGAASLWRILTAAPEADPQDTEAPETPIASLPADSEEKDRDWSKLDPSQLWRDGAEAEPPPDPLVHCRLGGEEEDAYLRSSECEHRGGQALEEPDWAKTE